MVSRYGDFVLYRPPLQSSTVFLWAGPFLLLLVGLGVSYLVVKRRAVGEGTAP
jgi:cytochrome c-type biogenesis protein CcmH